MANRKKTLPSLREYPAWLDVEKLKDIRNLMVGRIADDSGWPPFPDLPGIGRSGKTDEMNRPLVGTKSGTLVNSGVNYTRWASNHNSLMMGGNLLCIYTFAEHPKLETAIVREDRGTNLYQMITPSTREIHIDGTISGNWTGEQYFLKLIDNVLTGGTNNAK